MHHTSEAQRMRVFKLLFRLCEPKFPWSLLFGSFAKAELHSALLALQLQLDSGYPARMKKALLCYVKA